MKCFQLREYKSLCRELEGRADAAQRERDTALQEIDALCSALVATEERLKSAETQHTFDLETALIKLQGERKK